MPKYCPDCGEENPEKAKFCCNCSSVFPEQGTRKIAVLNNRYEIKRLIKSGAMGSVYQAFDLNLGINVALKKVLDSNLSDEERKYARDRFREEARILSQLHHSGLPKVTDSFSDNDPDTGKPAYYLVQTLINGRDLESIGIARGNKPYPVEKSLDYMLQILEILRYLHSQSPPIIYRDLKPSNIMVDDGRVVLVDFGIARVFTPQQKGTVIGTPGYAAPEQYKGYAEPKSDIYALGVLMHFMLTGKDPEDPSTSPFIFEPAGDLNPDVPDWIESLISNMTATELGKRPSSAADIIETLKRSSRTVKLSEPQDYSAPSKSGILDKISGFFSTIGKKANENISINISAKQPDQTIRSNAEQQNRQKQPDAKPADDRDSVEKSRTERMFGLIMENGIQDIRQLLVSGFDIDNNRNDKGWTPLHAAAFFEKHDIAELFVKFGADVNSTENFGWTPLHIAASQGSGPIVELLLKSGANSKIKDKAGKFPWEYAESRGYDALSGRLKAGLPKRYTDIHHAIRAGDLQEVKQFLHDGADLSARDKSGLTPLHNAVTKDNNEIINLLLTKSVALDEQNSIGKTALHFAVFNGKSDAVRMLISAGADVNVQDNEGNTPLHIAVLLGLTRIVEQLIANNADVLIRDKSGKLASDIARSKGHSKLLETLRRIELHDEIDTPVEPQLQFPEKKEKIKNWVAEGKTVLTVTGDLGPKVSIVELHHQNNPGGKLVNRLAESAVPEMVAAEVEVHFEISGREIDDFNRGFMFALGYSPIFVKAVGENPENIQNIMEGRSSHIFMDEEGVLYVIFGSLLSGREKHYAMARANIVDLLIRGILMGALADFTENTFKTPQARFKSNPLFALGFFSCGEAFSYNSSNPAIPKFLPLTSFLGQLV
ncbi:MAG: ankyrin repeat domain-containing protein [Firmicutes bacterium]|nr:ankyrin repeat domain-containing protein [Bacillota bacterium]